MGERGRKGMREWEKRKKGNEGMGERKGMKKWQKRNEGRGEREREKRENMDMPVYRRE